MWKMIKRVELTRGIYGAIFLQQAVEWYLILYGRGQVALYHKNKELCMWKSVESMDPLRGIYGATRVNKNSWVQPDSMRRATGSFEKPKKVASSCVQWISVGRERDPLPKKANMPTYFHPTCLVHAV